MTLCSTRASSIPRSEWNARATKPLPNRLLRVHSRARQEPDGLDCRGDAAKVWQQLRETRLACSIAAIRSNVVKNRYGVIVIWKPTLRVEGS